MYISRRTAFLTLVFFSIALGFFLLRGREVFPRSYSVSDSISSMPAVEMAVSQNTGYDMDRAKMAISSVYPAPDAVMGGQMFIQDTSLSLVANDPLSTEQKVREITTEIGGFLVSTNISRPEESSTATITVRVPTTRLDEALRRFEEAGQRLVQKSVQGQDVTEQYQDIEAQIATLNTVQVRLEQLLERADDANALLQIQQQIFQIQSQKDSLEGQRRYLQGAAELTRVTVYVSSDEYALPYVPEQPWKPETVFKLAIRSLVTTLRGFGTAAIWGVVYIPLLIPFVLIVWLVNRSRQK